MNEERKLLNSIKEVTTRLRPSLYPLLIEHLVNESYAAATWTSATKASDFVRNVEESIKMRVQQYPTLAPEPMED